MVPNPVSSLLNRALKKQKAEILHERCVPPVQQHFCGSSGKEVDLWIFFTA